MQNYLRACVGAESESEYSKMASAEAPFRHRHRISATYEQQIAVDRMYQAPKQTHVPASDSCRRACQCGCTTVKASRLEADSVSACKLCCVRLLEGVACAPPVAELVTVRMRASKCAWTGATTPHGPPLLQLVSNAHRQSLETHTKKTGTTLSLR
jgi:hypothetical protein